jgi:hypothetical protein
MLILNRIGIIARPAAATCHKQISTEVSGGRNTLQATIWQFLHLNSHGCFISL